MIPDPLVITLKRPGKPDKVFTIPRNQGESEADHVRRACRQVLEFLENEADPSPEDTLQCAELGIEIERGELETNAAFVTAFCGELLQEA